MKKISLVIVVFMLGVLGFSQEATISVMTYNIRLDVASDGENAWPNRKEGLVKQIQFYEPSIFGIQEGLPHQTIYLDEELAEYEHFGIGRYGEGKGEQSAIFYKKNEFEVLESSTFWLSLTPNAPSKNWDAALPRICTYGLFKEKKTGNKFWVFNTHFDHIGVESRLKAIDLVQEKIERLNDENLPVIFMGDLNVEPDSKVISKLKNFMLDAYEVSKTSAFGSYGTFNGFKFKEEVGPRIDYIFVSNTENIKVMKHAVLTDSKDLKYYSDHFAVLALLLINN
ncbi:MAG: endonuclease/exonuclease/phosphatase [Bacteroidetes bacterium MedPE-SWsnd-G1]|nr:MAG: endonuclease/exonuclease/phosphatase [Bacteroidetes bacterium MedPE-SWsnd-G1]